MANGIVIVILVIIAIFAIREAIKHNRGEGGCCGGGGAVKKTKKHLKNVVAKKKMVISGMVCANCVTRVQNALNALDGVSANVKLDEKTAEISLSEDVPEELLMATVENLGYQVESIESQSL